MIFAIKPFEIHDGDGIRTTVFFKGCPLRCKWCHNPESLSPKKQLLFDLALCCHCLKCAALCNANTVHTGQHIFIRENCTLCEKCVSLCPKEAFEISGRDISVKELVKEVLRDEIFMKGSGGGVTFSGGEPLMQPELCLDIAKQLKQHDLNIAIDTSGFVPRESLDKLLPYADTFLFDIKAIREDVHIACTGASNKQILENIKYVDSLNIPIEIRYPYVPGMNDGEAKSIGSFIKDLRSVKAVRVLPYHAYAERKYACLGLQYPLPDIPLPSKEEIATAVETIQRFGVKNVSSH